MSIDHELIKKLKDPEDKTEVIVVTDKRYLKNVITLAEERCRVCQRKVWVDQANVEVIKNKPKTPVCVYCIHDHFPEVLGKLEQCKALIGGQQMSLEQGIET